jgi:hypothetical protein
MSRETAEDFADTYTGASNEIILEKYNDTRLQMAVEIMVATLAAGNADGDGSDGNGSIWGAFSVVIMLCVLLYNVYVYFHNKRIDDHNKRIDDYREAVSSGKMDCEHPEVLQLAKEAIALGIKKMSTPTTYEEQISYLNEDHISLGSIKTLFTPQTPEAEKPGALKDRIHGCSATAKIRIKPSVTKQITVQTGLFLQLQDNTIEIDAVYGTGRSLLGGLEVEVYLNPLTEVLLRSIFQAKPSAD